jgi:uncharacterized membrane protein YfcA
MNGSFYLADANLWQLALVCIVGFVISVLSGMSGYGAGLVMPVFLTPLVGISNVIPVMAITMLLNTGSRAMAFWKDVQWDHVRKLLLFGLPMCIAGAYCYTLLTSRWIALLLGIFLLVSIPLRRLLTHLKYQLSHNGERISGIGFGFINGGMAGTGIILISILMSAGLHGATLIATDATISTILAILKIIIFSATENLNLDLAAAGMLTGLCMSPGGFIARRLLDHIPVRVHAWVMEIVVFVGSLMIIWRALWPVTP